MDIFERWPGVEERSSFDRSTETGAMTEERLITKLTMIASQLEHEEDLMGQRTNWRVVSQSFLLGTFVAVIALSGGTGMDNGAGLGASHQTGWTGVIARLMQLFGTITSEQLLEGGIGDVFRKR